MPEFYDIEPSLMGGMRAPSAAFYLPEDPDQDEEPEDEEPEDEEEEGEEDDQNAALISAAPDLLAALKALLPHVPGYQSGDFAGRPWLDQALAAIAKATSF